MPFPAEGTERATIELVALLAPPRSLVDTLTAERGIKPHDAQTGTAREFSYQASALEAGHGRDETIVRLRVLVDAHVGVRRTDLSCLSRCGRAPYERRV